jgi:hypothetical protein
MEILSNLKVIQVFCSFYLDVFGCCVLEVLFSLRGFPIPVLIIPGKVNGLTRFASPANSSLDP